MKIHANVTRRLEVQFVDEHGFGWGVTQGPQFTCFTGTKVQILTLQLAGFYTAVALELQRADDTVLLWLTSTKVLALLVQKCKY
jgi:hypothetical protein